MITPYEMASIIGSDALTHPYIAAASIDMSGVFNALRINKQIELLKSKQMDTSNNTSYPAKTTGLDFTEAMKAITEGFKVRIPEWTGYWFRNGKDISVLTRTGDVINTPNFNNYVMRDDWQIVTEGLGFDFAILALEAGKAVRRSNWTEGIYITMNHAGGTISTPWILCVNPAVGSYTWGPYSVELFSTDWEVFDPTTSSLSSGAGAVQASSVAMQGVSEKSTLPQQESVQQPDQHL